MTRGIFLIKILSWPLTNSGGMNGMSNMRLVTGAALKRLKPWSGARGRGFPRKLDAQKWIVEGRGVGGWMVLVVYLLSPDPVAYVIHAMPLTTRRRRRRR